MNKIIYIRPQDKYLHSYWETFDAVARERKYLASTQRFPFESTVEFYKNITGKGLPRVFAIDTETDRCIGWCDIIDKTETTGYLGTGLLKEYRNMGVGTAMLTAALKQADEYGFSEVELQVLESNTRAIHVYKKLGFEHIAIRDKKHIWKDTMESENVLIMKKAL
ncbi:MAG: GNAT family N-acetyltransferase [Oscillospiraceae bacterium]|nr:GNAT family N-acetyltransferase [Oscillospiraceae bacterium]